MRGRDERSEGLFSYVRLEERIPADHPLRAIRLLCDEALGAVCIHRNHIMAQARWTNPMKAVRVFSQRRAILRKRLSLLKKHST